MHNTVLTKMTKGFEADFLQTSSFRIHLVCLAFIFPFTVNHLLSGRYESAIVNSVIFAIGLFNVWSMWRRNHYYSRITLLVLLPVVIASLVFSIREQGIVGIFSCYAAILGFYFMLPERQAWFANAAILLTSITVAFVVLESNQVISFAATLVLVSLFSAIFINVIYKQQRKLQLLAATDTLTGLFNRTLLYQSLEQAIEQHKRKDIPMTIINFDIDHFKSVNDTFGHDVGDDLLRNLGTLLKERVRRTDKVFRLGGEEFLVLLFDADLKEGQEVAEDLRSRIASAQFLANHPVTISLGVATLISGENLTEWVKRSDEYLYLAKSSGRNKVIYQTHITNITTADNSPILAVN